MKYTFSILFLFFATLFSLQAQEISQQEIQELLQSKKFQFIPQSVSPMSGGTRQVTSDFSLKITGSSMDSYLPYFGRAYSIVPGEAGMVFQSASINYKLKKKKKGWEVSMKPEDIRDVKQMQLTVYENGYASLFVNSTNRQAIRYYGYIKALE